MRRDTSPRSLGDDPVRFLLRLPAALHGPLVRGAEAHSISLNEYIVRRLSAGEPHPAFERLTPVLLARARAAAGRHLVGIVLHGSWTRDDAGPTSDIDALIVVDSALALTRRLYHAWDQAPMVWEGRAVDAHFVHLPQRVERAGGLWCEAAVEGRLVADRAGQIDDVLVRTRRAIADGRLVRKRAHGQPYWTVAA